MKKSKKDPKQEAIDYWKEWHRKVVDALPDLKVYETSCTLSEVRDVVQRERDLAAFADALCEEVHKHDPQSVVARSARQYLANRR